MLRLPVIVGTMWSFIMVIIFQYILVSDHVKCMQ